MAQLHDVAVSFDHFDGIGGPQCYQSGNARIERVAHGLMRRAVFASPMASCVKIKMVGNSIKADRWQSRVVAEMKKVAPYGAALIGRVR